VTSTIPNDLHPWLLDADPSIRWQALRDFGAPSDIVEAQRQRVATEGWGARLLAAQRPDGNWADPAVEPPWRANLFTLFLLRDFGLDPASAPARRAIERVRDQVTWGPEFGDSPFFEGEIEPCINGNTLAIGSWFGVPSERLAERLIGEQLSDGGWNCEAERGSVRSSFHTTICVLEGLLAFERATTATSAVTAARHRGEEYLLERRLHRRLSTGAPIDERWARFTHPPLWQYDVLRGLDYLRHAGVPPDERAEEAVAFVRARRQPDGRWHLDARARDAMHEELEDGPGRPSRWITLRALGVLEWARAGTAASEAAPSPPAT
jgi:hypothetical protein